MISVYWHVLLLVPILVKYVLSVTTRRWVGIAWTLPSLMVEFCCQALGKAIHFICIVRNLAWTFCRLILANVLRALVWRVILSSNGRLTMMDVILLLAEFLSTLTVEEVRRTNTVACN